ncbi:MAG: copper resistance protein CopC [Hyphomicrobiaceae bacterium]|nr:copper resistance protein CopC [Hyphomicrobiaceae bacterium]
MKTIALALVVFLAGAILPAAAHSQRRMTVPEDGAVLSASPEEIVLTFDAQTQVTYIALKNAQGEVVSLETADRMRPLVRFTAEPGAMGAGAYEVEWRGLSADGHPLQGRFGFSVEP